MPKLFHPPPPTHTTDVTAVTPTGHQEEARGLFPSQAGCRHSSQPRPLSSSATAARGEGHSWSFTEWEAVGLSGVNPDVTPLSLTLL